MHKIGIYYNEQGLREIMKGPEIAGIEQDLMMQRLGQVKVEFLQTFGFEGEFEVKRVDTNSKRSRTTFRIVANNARTTAALKRQPGWLAKYSSWSVKPRNVSFLRFSQSEDTISINCSSVEFGLVVLSHIARQCFSARSITA